MNNLNANISPTGMGETSKVNTGIKRLNQRPLIIVSIVLMIILMGLGYATMKRAEKAKAKEEVNGQVRNDGESLASDFLSKLYQSRSKEEENNHPLVTKEKLPLTSNEMEKPLTLERTKNPLDSSSSDEALKKRLEEERLALQSYKLELYRTALTAPTKVKLSQNFSQSSPSNFGNTPNMTAPNPADIYSQIAKAYKGANSSTANNEDSKLNQNEQFLKNQKASHNYLAARKTKPISPYEMKTGTLIPSVLITEINSELPGPIKAQVSENVFDTATGEHLLIPQGSTLIGAYSSNVQYGQNRVLIAFNRIIFPDGQTLNLDGMNGINQQGAAGFNDQVNNHYFKIFGSALFMGAITGGIAMADNTRADQFIETNRQKMLGALISELGQVARQMIQKNMNIAPTLEIRAGYRFNIFATKDIILEPLEY
ncbi:MAG: Conjugative transfer protein TrbI [uncultured Sulfurovum sp.]|uniref:Conjugative transfer protein TrbI n=1 Tax=uncultured Sulfurovum sp. TaxID=269237 RepID=A0A6S6RXD9_9BACT|nr:MAG: Conjugative transfer protein TrbI [uncultured Sulfurovum sp.]